MPTVIRQSWNLLASGPWVKSVSRLKRNQRLSCNGIQHRIVHIANACFVVVLVASLVTAAVAGLRGPGKYSGVVIFDRWGGCILFSGVYLMYISDSVKEQLREYEGQAIEIHALEVNQPINPGDGLIRRLKILGPAQSKQAWYRVEGISLGAQPVEIKGSLGVELTITNEGNTRVRIDSSQIGFALLSNRIEGAQTPSDGPSIAVITRADASLAHGSWQIGAGSKTYTYSYFIADDDRFPRAFELAPNESRKLQIAFELPAGHYQFFVGYGGGVHESKSIVSNPVSLDLWKDQAFPETE
jgi:hypothetical protein